MVSFLRGQGLLKFVDDTNVCSPLVVVSANDEVMYLALVTRECEILVAMLEALVGLVEVGSLDGSWVDNVVEHFSVVVEVVHVLVYIAVMANDNESGVLIRRKSLARLEDRDDSSDDTDEELEGKETTAEKGKGKVADVILDPATSVVIGASPTVVALAAAHQPRMRKWNSDSSTPTTAKKVRRPVDAALEDAATAAKSFIFRRLEHMIPASDLQVINGASCPIFCSRSRITASK
nr:hypothetical protein Iba_chr01bCG7250 [Ipomoea batatas]